VAVASTSLAAHGVVDDDPPAPDPPVDEPLLFVPLRRVLLELLPLELLPVDPLPELESLEPLLPLELLPDPLEPEPELPLDPDPVEPVPLVDPDEPLPEDPELPVLDDPVPEVPLPVLDPEVPLPVDPVPLEPDSVPVPVVALPDMPGLVDVGPPPTEFGDVAAPDCEAGVVSCCEFLEQPNDPNSAAVMRESKATLIFRIVRLLSYDFIGCRMRHPAPRNHRPDWSPKEPAERGTRISAHPRARLVRRSFRAPL
jgi:hypothetical protein